MYADKKKKREIVEISKIESRLPKTLDTVN